MDSGLYRASSKLLWVPPGGKSVFGGQVMGQALHAAQLTVHRDSWLPISLHSYFLKRGSPNSDIIYQCRETSNLRSFDSRSVDAIQNGQIIFKMQAQFARPEESQLRHVERADGVTGMPRGVVAPDECLGMDDLLGDLMARAPAALLPLIEELRASPIEVRYAVGAPHDPLDPDPPSMPSRQLLWVRIREPITKAPGLDAACAAYISDQPLLLTALRPHRISFPSPKLGALATLDHSMWFHGPFDADDWLLYDMHAPFAGSGRALCFGHLYRPDTGQLVASCAQQGVLRLAKPTLKNKAALFAMRGAGLLDRLRAAALGWTSGGERGAGGHG